MSVRGTFELLAELAFDHGNGVSGSTDRGHHAWQSHAEGNCTKQRRPARSKTELAEAAIQCLVRCLRRVQIPPVWPRLLPSEGTAIAEQGLHYCSPTASSQTPDAGTLSHAFANILNPASCTPRTNDAESLHGVAWPVGGLRHGRKQIKSVGNESLASWCVSARV